MLRLVEAPLVDPISVEELKLHLRIDSDAEDVYLASLIKAATSFLDGPKGWLLGHCMVEQTWDYLPDAWPTGRRLEIPLTPVQSVDAVTYYDGDGVEQIWPSDSYTVFGLNGRFAGIERLSGASAWPSTYDQAFPIAVRVVAGYPAIDGSNYDYRGNIPAGLRIAVQLLSAQLYEQRLPGGAMDFADLPKTMVALLSPYRRYVVA